jgi:hypothetical protein
LVSSWKREFAHRDRHIKKEHAVERHRRKPHEVMHWSDTAVSQRLSADHQELGERPAQVLARSPEGIHPATVLILSF